MSPSIPRAAGLPPHREDTSSASGPCPDLSKPPLHTLPREELIAKLKTLTNLRVVRDAESATGWKLDPRSLPGVGDGADVVDPASLNCGSAASELERVL